MRHGFAVLFLKAQPDVIDNDRPGMKQTVHDVIPRHPMPKAHHQEVDQVSHLADANAIFDQLVLHDEESRSHEDEIPEPKA